ncbi:MAG: chemotaxis protein CheD [Sarcina sp.]
MSIELGIKVGIADLKVAKSPEKIITIGLGSCVGIAIYDKYKKVGGLAHIMLSDSKNFRSNNNLLKFADTAIPILIEKVQNLGGNKRFLEAKIVGGASMFNFSDTNVASRIGEKNVLMVEKVLEENRVPIVAKDTGGNKGRTMTLYLESGVVTIKTVGKGIKDI